MSFPSGSSRGWVRGMLAPAMCGCASNTFFVMIGPSYLSLLLISFVVALNWVVVTLTLFIFALLIFFIVTLSIFCPCICRCLVSYVCCCLVNFVHCCLVNFVCCCINFIVFFIGVQVQVQVVIWRSAQT